MAISVCLASYNGERHIRRQIDTILAQLPADAELIVSDDASTDGTVAAVRAIDDPRIRLFAHGENVHYVRNFERAIAAAGGDILFLSDQDDEWTPDKLSTMLKALDAHPNAALVVHAMSQIDEGGEPSGEAPRLWREQDAGERSGAAFLARQLVKGQVFGCTAAFRRSLLPVLLPFPAATYAHDHWLSVAAPTRGSVVLLNDRLVRYRRHDTNVSPARALSPGRQLLFRARLLRLAAIALARAARLRIAR